VNTVYRRTVLRISGEALMENARLIRRHLQGKTRMMAVVKADAYGHGLVPTAKVELAAGADYLAVALVEEGVTLREAGVRAPVLVLGGSTPEALNAAVQNHLAQAVYDPEDVRLLQKEAARLDTVAHAHLKIDTGMTRIGVRGGEALEKVLATFKDCPRVKLEGVFTHFAAADDDPEYTRAQNARFVAAVARIRAEGVKPIVHAAASEATLRDPTLWHDMVRPGIALYGASVQHLLPDLTPAQTLSTRPVRLARVPAGETIGYGRTFKTERDSLIMTLPIGYGDGYPRILSNRAHVLVRGKRAPLVGRVCMDMITADVTDIPGVTADDEVVLLGAQGDERITPDELAMLADTIPYEIMLGFSPRVTRIFDDV
jgi:alanine racemase